MFDRLVALRTDAEALAHDLDAGVVGGREAAQWVEELGAVLAVVNGMVGRMAKRVADTDAHLAEGDRNATAFVARALGVGCGEAKAAIDTATKLEALPVVAAAVTAGSISAKQAAKIAATASIVPGSEERLLEAAAEGMVPLHDECIAVRAEHDDPTERAERHRKLRTLRIWTDDDGMIAGRFRLAPELGGQIKTLIDGDVQRIFRKSRGKNHEPHDAYAADALVERMLASKAAEAERSTEKTTEKAPVLPDVRMHVVIDHAALVRGYTIDGETCEIVGSGPVPVAWARELLGTAFLTAIIKKGKDITTVAHLGRHIGAEIETGLVVAGRECRIIGCHQRGYLERDHNHDFAKGGPTSYDNLCWFCYQHHRLKSKGWTLSPPDPETGKFTLIPPVEDTG